MPRYRTAYPREFRRQLVDLVRSGGTPEELARELEPTAQSICTWEKQAGRDAGKRFDGPTSAEREELTRLRRENHRRRQERDILAKAAACSRGRASPADIDASGRSQASSDRRPPLDEEQPLRVTEQLWSPKEHRHHSYRNRMNWSNRLSRSTPHG